MNERRRVAVVTGGGGGIGAAVAEELGRSGWFVVTVDPLVTLDGTQQIATEEETTAERIRGAGGFAMASAASVTDREALITLFDELTKEHGPLDAVVNVAGITRQTGFAHGSAEDWSAVLDVHLGGFLNVLNAALPHMVAQGHGSVLGVTSGSGWRATNAGAYSCAKRAIASLVWQLGRQLPPNVTVNAISPIAATRMVAAAAERARKAGTGGASGGLSLFDSMPQPAELAPLAAHLVGDTFRWCSGRVVFAGGSELAVIEEPRLLELVRTDGDVPVSSVLQATVPRALAPAEASQASDGGGNPRFGALFSDPSTATPTHVGAASCVLVSDRSELVARMKASLEAQSVVCNQVTPTHGFAGATDALQQVVAAHGPMDAIVVFPAGSISATSQLHVWERSLAEHDEIRQQIEDDAGWSRAAADYAGTSDRAIRLVTLIDAVNSGGRSRAQASAQLSRVARDTTKGKVGAFSVSLESGEHELSHSVGDVVSYLLGVEDALDLGGAELVLRGGWLGLRGHPRPMGSLIFGGPALPAWFDETMAEIVGVEREAST
jgi:NAD(P)-dependent dehydrogenase (short-subunit alcohol dehydrogenase family)